MLFDLMSYPGWLAAALAMGIVVGWRTYGDGPRRSLLAGWFKWGVLLFVIGVIVAVLKLFPGRFGLWLEIFLLMTAVYIVGCFLGGWFKNLLGAHTTGGAARAAADRLAAETAAAKAEAARKNAASARAQVDRLAAGVSARVEPDRRVGKVEMERPARMLPRRATQRLLPLPRWRRIILQRKLVRKRSTEEKLPRVSKPRRIMRLRQLPRRPRLSDKLPPRPRRIISLQRLPRGPKSNDRLILVASPRRLRRPMEGRTISG
jgi:hypothetical protein